MNKEEIRRRFLEAVEPRIPDDSPRFVDNANFDALVNMDGQRYHSYFYSLGYDPDFDHRCELFQNMLHDIDDDGDMSLVYMTIKHPYVADIGRLWWRQMFLFREFETTSFTVVRGWHKELSRKYLTPILFYHFDSNLVKHSRITECIACRFDWNVLNFIASLKDVLVDDDNEWKLFGKVRCDRDAEIRKFILYQKAFTEIKR